MSQPSADARPPGADDPPDPDAGRLRRRRRAVHRVRRLDRPLLRRQGRRRSADDRLPAHLRRLSRPRLQREVPRPRRRTGDHDQRLGQAERGRRSCSSPSRPSTSPPTSQPGYCPRPSSARSSSTSSSPRPTSTRRLPTVKTIPADRSSETLRIMDAVAAGERILRAIDPSQLDATTSALADMLDQNGENIGRFIERASNYLGTMLEHSDAFYRDLRLLGNVTQGAADAEPHLVAALRNSHSTLRLVVEQRRAVDGLIGGTTGLSGDTTGFLQHNEKNLVGTVYAGEPIVHVYNGRRDKLAQLLQAVPHVLSNGANGVKDGKIVMEGLMQFPFEFGRPYSAKDCTRYVGATAAATAPAAAATTPRTGVRPDEESRLRPPQLARAGPRGHRVRRRVRGDDAARRRHPDQERRHRPGEVPRDLPRHQRAHRGRRRADGRRTRRPRRGPRAEGRARLRHLHRLRRSARALRQPRRDQLPQPDRPALPGHHPRVDLQPAVPRLHHPGVAHQPRPRPDCAVQRVQAVVRPAASGRRQQARHPDHRRAPGPGADDQRPDGADRQADRPPRRARRGDRPRDHQHVGGDADDRRPPRGPERADQRARQAHARPGR